MYPYSVKKDKNSGECGVLSVQCYKTMLNQETQGKVYVSNNGKREASWSMSQNNAKPGNSRQSLYLKQWKKRGAVVERLDWLCYGAESHCKVPV